MKRNVYLMYAITFFQGFVFYGSISTIYRQMRGIGLGDIYRIEALSIGVMLICEIPWGYFADRWGYKKTLITGNAIFFISKIIFYKANCLSLFLLERLLLALAVSALSGCDTALLYGSIEKEDSEKVFGRYNAFGTFGFLVASSASIFMLSEPVTLKSINRVGFWTIIPYGIALLLSLFLKEVKGCHEQSMKVSLKEVWANKQMIVFVMSISLLREVVQSVTVFLNQVQYLKCGIEVKYFGLILVMMQVAPLVSAKAYKLSAKWGRSRSLWALGSCISIGCYVLMTTQGRIVSLSSIFIISLSMACIEPMSLEIQNESIEKENRATSLSIYAMIGDGLGAGISPIVGTLAEQAIESGFMVCSLLGLISGCLGLGYHLIKNK